jgi:predicted Zn-dependent peptidase
MFDPYDNFQMAVLPNGLTVYAAHWPERPGMRFKFGVHSGARHDLSGKEGCAHYMEHLVNNNALISPEDLEEFFDSNSGYMPNLGQTSFDSTYYGFHSSVEPDLLSTSLRYFGHMLLEATLEKFVERERKVIVGEFNRAFPVEYLYQLTRRAHLSVFPNTCFSRMVSPLGTLESIKALTQADLQEFYDTHYTPANMSVVAVGELTLEQTIQFLEASPFGITKPGKRSARTKVVTEPPYPIDVLEYFNEGKYVQGKTVAKYASLAQFPGTINDSELLVFIRMLNRELFNKVRKERAWAYDIRCGAVRFSDFFLLRIASDGLKLEAVEQIEEVIDDCIKSIADNTSLFRSVQAAIINKKHFSDPNVMDVVNNSLEEVMYKGRVVSLAEEMYLIGRVSMDDIRRLVGYVLPGRRRTCIRHP